MKRYLPYVPSAAWAVACLLVAVPMAAQDSPPQDRETETPAASAAPKPAEDRIRFNFELTGAHGGGQATGFAGNVEYQKDEYLIATGGVDFKYRGLRLQADRARVDIPTNLLTAEGNVILDEGPQRLIGETIEYDLDTRTGRVTEATAFVSSEYYFSGSQIAKTGDDTFTVDDGIFTSCSQDVPSWSIHMSEARVTLEEYARIKNARLKFKKVPVFYAPYMLWPANTERSSGLLVPKPGYSKRRGAEVSLAYFKTLGRSADSTFVLDLSADEYFGFGNEVRWRPSEATRGYFKAYALSEPKNPATFNNEFSGRDSGDLRWKVELLHEIRDFWGGFRGVVSFQDYSDFDYLQDFERDVNQQRQAFVYSNAFVSKNSGPHSLNILVDQRERIRRPGFGDVRRQLPEVEYRLRNLRLGKSQIYLDLQSALHYFSLDLTETISPGETVSLSKEYGRVDFLPTLSIPLSSLPWLSAEVEVGGRATYYTDSLTPLDPLAPGQEFTGDSLDRTFGRAGLKIIGPSILRIFDKKIGRFAKIKHIVEPRWTYSFVGDFANQDNIFRFDEIDSLSPVNGLLFSLTNRIVAKPANEDQGGAVEIASVTVSQGLSLDSNRPGQQSRFPSAADPRVPRVQTDEGPLGLALRVNPSRATSVRLDAGFSTLFGSPDIQSLRLSGSTAVGRHAFGLSWFSNWLVDLDPAEVALGLDNPQVLSTKTSEQAQVSAKLALLPQKLSLEAQLSFDVLGRRDPFTGERSPWDLLQQRYFLNWTSQCYSMQLEYRESSYRDIEDRDVRFSFTLKNVGTFLDLNDSF